VQNTAAVAEFDRCGSKANGGQEPGQGIDIELFEQTEAYGIGFVKGGSIVPIRLAYPQPAADLQAVSANHQKIA
jgi:hypothetical protein